MYDPITATAALASQGGDPGDPTAPPVDNKTRQDWNDYVDWLDKKGLKGHPSLDHNEKGFQMIDQYRKENPGTTVSREMVTPIQQEFSKYRDYALGQIQKGGGAFAPGTNKDNFLRALSTVDGIPGQRTTSYKFPLGYMKDMNTGEVKNKGFMTSDKPAADQLTSK